MPANRRWILRRRPVGAVAADDLEYVVSETPALAEGEILLRNLYLSIDPTSRLWMSDQDQYMVPVKLGEPMRGGVLGVVEASRSSLFRPGDLAIPNPGAWESYTVAPATTTRRIEPVPGLPITAHMSVLGSAGRTAYFGITDIGRPQPGETVVVTAAAGAVGSLAGQIAKIAGARVVGVAGGPDKCRRLVQEFGFDAAIDYRSENVGAALDRLCPDGIDVDFENVGGPIMNDVFDRLNDFGRLVLCGMIATYNSDGPKRGPDDFGRILMHRLTVRGFINGDYAARSQEAWTAIARWIAEGRLKWSVHVVEGLDQAVAAVHRLFTGEHDGKLLVRISPEPD